MKAKDRSMIARMAGNIAGQTFVGHSEWHARSYGEDTPIPVEHLKVQAANAVLLAMEIVECVDRTLKVSGDSEE